MALLSQTQGTPERVWAAVLVLAAHGGTMPREDMRTWLRPPFEDDYDESRSGGDRIAVDQVVQAAGGLGLLSSGRTSIDLLVPPPGDIHGFADLVHDLLVGMQAGDADADIFDGYACAVIQTEVEGSRLWFDEWTNVKLADLLTRSLRPRNVDSSDQRFNSSRPATWRRWLSFAGMSEVLNSRSSLLSCTVRLDRELRRSSLPRDVAIPAEDLLLWSAGRMPYLDGGALYVEAAARMGFTPRPTLSRVLSAALRDLHEDGIVRLLTPRGDAQGGVRLSSDPLALVQQFNAVVLVGDSDA